MIRNYLFNGYRRLSAEVLFFLVPFGTGLFLAFASPSYPSSDTPQQVTQYTLGQKAATPTKTAKQVTSLPNPINEVVIGGLSS